jgi:hypothetical protein
MSKELFRESLPKEVAKYLVGATLGTLGTLGLALWQEVGAPVFSALDRAASKPILVRATLLLLLLNLLSWAVFWLVRRRPVLPLTQRLDFDAYGGYYIDPKTGNAVCPRCLSEGNIVHMMNVGGPRKCNACDTICRGKTS